MIDSKAKSTVKIVRETASAWSCENPYHVDNVNQAQGPRVGTAGAHSAKRTNFTADKAERQVLADIVARGFEGRAAELEANPGEKLVKGAGGIASNNPPRQLRRATAK